jgi:thymidylate synthase ThyX
MKPTGTDNTYLRQTETGETEITPGGWAYLEQAVTNTKDDVYGFLPTLSPTIIAAAMARLSRFGGDLRELLLKEFADKAGQEEALLRRILTQFGDDSVQQLGTVPLVVENASILLTKYLERGRLAAYLEQSTRYIYYDTKRGGRYRYFTPGYLPPALTKIYRSAMDRIFDNYALLVHEMTDYYYRIGKTPDAERDVPWRIAMRGKACDAARGLLPIATTSTVGIVGSGQAIDNLIMHLLSQDLPEAQTAGQQILREVRKTHSIFFERTDLPKRGQATIEYKRRTRQLMAKMAAQLIPATPHTQRAAAVTLLDYTPKQEFDLLAHMLFAYVPISFAELQTALVTWSDDERRSVFELYMGERSNRRHRPGRALEIAHYTFELVSEYGAFKDLQRHRMVDGLEWQLLSPNLGFDVPQSVREAGFAELYTETVRLADELYESLVRAGFTLEAQYATLHVHKLRWKVTLNAREALHMIELRSQPAGHIAYRKIAATMHEEIAKVHPTLAKAMIFVNRTDDDPAISRLEQARYAEQKLRALGLEGLME